MVCYDGSIESIRALKTANEDAHLLGANIDVVNVITRDDRTDSVYITHYEEKLSKEIKNHINIYENLISIRIFVSFLSPGEELLQYCEDNEFDRIYIGVKKKSKLDKLFFGSTAQQIILFSKCSVVAVK